VDLTHTWYISTSSLTSDSLCVCNPSSLTYRSPIKLNRALIPLLDLEGHLTELDTYIELRATIQVTWHHAFNQNLKALSIWVISLIYCWTSTLRINMRLNSHLIYFNISPLTYFFHKVEDQPHMTQVTFITAFSSKILRH
jgi:hypothetical protein